MPIPSPPSRYRVRWQEPQHPWTVATDSEDPPVPPAPPSLLPSVRRDDDADKQNEHEDEDEYESEENDFGPLYMAHVSQTRSTLHAPAPIPTHRAQAEERLPPRESYGYGHRVPDHSTERKRKREAMDVDMDRIDHRDAPFRVAARNAASICGILNPPANRAIAFDFDFAGARSVASPFAPGPPPSTTPTIATAKTSKPRQRRPAPPIATVVADAGDGATVDGANAPPKKKRKRKGKMKDASTQTVPQPQVQKEAEEESVEGEDLKDDARFVSLNAPTPAPRQMASREPQLSVPIPTVPLQPVARALETQVAASSRPPTTRENPAATVPGLDDDPVVRIEPGAQVSLLRPAISMARVQLERYLSAPGYDLTWPGLQYMQNKLWVVQRISSSYPHWATLLSVFRPPSRVELIPASDGYGTQAQALDGSSAPTMSLVIKDKMKFVIQVPITYLTGVHAAPQVPQPVAQPPPATEVLQGRQLQVTVPSLYGKHQQRRAPSPVVDRPQDGDEDGQQNRSRSQPQQQPQQTEMQTPRRRQPNELSPLDVARTHRSNASPIPAVVSTLPPLSASPRAPTSAWGIPSFPVRETSAKGKSSIRSGSGSRAAPASA